VQPGIALNDKRPHVKQDYGPIPGSNPLGSVGDPSLSDCQTFPTNDLVEITLEFKREFGTLDTFKVGWASPGNDIDVYFFDADGNVIGKSAGSSNPEQVRLGNLANGTYYVCAVNFSGANTGITIDAKVEFLTLYKYTPPPETPVPKTVATPPPSTPATTAAPTAPAPTAEPVVTPGPNGPSKSQGLVDVAAGKQASNKAKRSIASLVFLILTIVIAVAGIAFVAMRIRRDTA
jgi:hypothetical protein